MAGTPDNIGYGTDPDLINPVVPWPRTMTPLQLETSAASAVGVPDFIDEWISAPYTQQRNDREIIVVGLEWLEQQSRSRNGHAFASAADNQAIELLDSIVHPDRAMVRDVHIVEFFARFRFLAVGAYYTTEAGIEDIGYIGNVPISGEYPGPSAEAMTHLAGVLEQLNLDWPN